VGQIRAVSRIRKSGAEAGGQLGFKKHSLSPICDQRLDS